MSPAKIRRRRWLALLALQAIVAVAVVMGVRQSPTYSLDSSVLLLPPTPAPVAAEQQGRARQSNVLLYLGSLNQSRDIVIEALSSSETETEVSQEHPGTTYTVLPDALESAPVVVLTARARSIAQVRDLIGDLLDLVPQALVDMQDGMGVPETGRVTTEVVTQPGAPRISRVGQIRTGALSGGVTAALLLGIALIGRSRLAAGSSSGWRLSGRGSRPTTRRGAASLPPTDGRDR